MRKEAAAETTIIGATIYEFKMQLRRRALWITFLLFGLALVLSRLTLTPWGPYSGDLPVPHLLANWSLSVQFLHPVAFGILLADRLPRDPRTRVSELLDTLPASHGARFLGKYLGATLATLLPVLLTWAAGIAYIAADRGAPGTVLSGLGAFAAINLPGLLFVAAFSVACPVVLWVPLYQFLFVGYWFWGNLIPTSPTGTTMPTLSHTLLTPLGEYAANGFFGTEQASVRATAWEAAASVSLLLGLAALALLCAHRYLRWQRAQQ